MIKIFLTIKGYYEGSEGYTPFPAGMPFSSCENTYELKVEAKGFRIKPENLMNENSKLNFVQLKGINKKMLFLFS